MTEITQVDRKAMEMSEELLPCPFCGGRAVLLCGGHAALQRGSERNYCVMCTGCQAASDDGFLIPIIAAWNTRAPDPALLTERTPK